MNNEQKIKKARSITLLGSFIDLILGVLKIFVGKIYFSQALITDGVHSLSDLLSDFFVYIMAKVSFSKADDEHPYGHGKFENLATTVIGTLLILVAMKMAYESYELLFMAKERTKPGMLTILIAVISIISKEWIYRKTLKVGEELKSSMIIANAWHSRTDAMSSLLILVGLVGAIFINEKIDLLVAFAVSLYIGKIGYDLIKDALIDLVDTSLDDEVKRKIAEIVLKVDGVKGYHNLRSRKIGSQAILDINIEVSPRISVSEGHQIATWVAKKLIAEIEDVSDITVHTDVEDDRGHGENYIEHESILLPLRKSVLKEIKQSLGLDVVESDIEDIIIHYIDNHIELDVYLKNSAGNLAFAINAIEGVEVKKVNLYKSL